MTPWERLGRAVLETAKEQAVIVLQSVIRKQLTRSIEQGFLSRPRMPNPTYPAQFQTLRAGSRVAVDGAVMSGDRGRAWAKYAIRRGLPEKEHDRRLLIENDPHEIDDFDGIIEDGYGKGKKTLLHSGPAVVKIDGQIKTGRINYHFHEADKAGPHYDLVVEPVQPGTRRFEIHVPDGPIKGRYVILRTIMKEGDGPGYGRQIMRMKDRGLVLPKPDYRLKEEDWLNTISDKDYIVERKLDGSLANVHIHEYRAAFRSHRETGETYYDKLPALEFLNNKSPFLSCRKFFPGPRQSGTILQGELVHDAGAAKMAGILNSLPDRARRFQEQHGYAHFHAWDVKQIRNRDVSHLPYEERRVLMKSVIEEIRFYNQHWNTVEQKPQDMSAIRYYQMVVNDGRGLPYSEGIIVKHRHENDVWFKVKHRPVADLRIVDFVEGKGKYTGSVGTIVVQNDGKTGEVGSFAIDDENRQWIWDHREQLKGAIAQIRTMELTEQDIPRSGVFLGIHPEKSPDTVRALLAEKNV